MQLDFLHVGFWWVKWDISFLKKLGDYDVLKEFTKNTYGFHKT